MLKIYFIIILLKNLLLKINIAKSNKVIINVGSDYKDKIVKILPLTLKNLDGATNYQTTNVEQVFTQ